MPADAGTIRVKITDLLSESWEGSIAMAKRARPTSASLDFAFFRFLWQFYQANRGTIRTHYQELTRKFLDFNDPEKEPQGLPAPAAVRGAGDVRLSQGVSGQRAG